MDDPTLWLSAPTDAYKQWQRTEAAGADRRAFSPRSIVQHEAMFERFMRHLTAVQRSLATFGPDHLESFFADLDRRCKPGTTTRLRYQKLLDRLGRHLVDVGVRKTNPAAVYTLTQTWPEDEPVPIYLIEDDDYRLQASIRSIDGLDDRALRNRAIVGLCWRPVSPRRKSGRRPPPTSTCRLLGRISVYRSAVRAKHVGLTSKDSQSRRWRGGEISLRPPTAHSCFHRPAPAAR